MTHVPYVSSSSLAAWALVTPSFCSRPWSSVIDAHIRASAPELVVTKIEEALR